MPLVQWSISVTLTHKSNYYTYFHSVTKYGIIFWGVSFPTVGRYSFYKRKSSELWLVDNPEPLVEN